MLYNSRTTGGCATIVTSTIVRPTPKPKVCNTSSSINEVYYGTGPLSGPVPSTYLIGVDSTTGTLYYKNTSGNWQLVSNIGTNSSLKSLKAKVNGAIGEPTEGLYTFQSDLFINSTFDFIIINGNIESIIDDSYTIDSINGVLIRLNPWLFGNTITIPIIRPLTVNNEFSSEFSNEFN